MSAAAAGGSRIRWFDSTCWTSAGTGWTGGSGVAVNTSVTCHWPCSLVSRTSAPAPPRTTAPAASRVHCSKVTSIDAVVAVRPPYWTAITPDVASELGLVLAPRNGAVTAAKAAARAPEIPWAVRRAATCAGSAPPGPHEEVASTSRTARSLATGSGSLGAIGKTRPAGIGAGVVVVGLGAAVVVVEVLEVGLGMPVLGGGVVGSAGVTASVHPARPTAAAPSRTVRRPTREGPDGRAGVRSGIRNLRSGRKRSGAGAPHVGADAVGLGVAVEPAGDVAVADAVRPEAGGHRAVAPEHQLEGHALLHLRGERHVEDEVAERVRDEASVVEVHALDPVRVGADDRGGAGLDQPSADVALFGNGVVDVLGAPVRVDHDDVGPGPQPADRVGHPRQVLLVERTGSRWHPHRQRPRRGRRRRRRLADRVERQDAEPDALALDHGRLEGSGEVLAGAGHGEPVARRGKGLAQRPVAVVAEVVVGQHEDVEPGVSHT